jgi:hypothetical protein
MNMAATGAEQVLRKIGGAFNVALAAGFAWAAFRLYGEAAARLELAGGLPPLSFEAAKAIVLSPVAPAVAGNLGIAWLCAVAAAGCGFMALLGARWSFHAGLRLVSSLRA